jgi:hypothetical protein
LNDECRFTSTSTIPVLDDAMPITISCPCGKKLRVADEHAGKRVKCPACQAVSTVPAPESEPEPEFEIIEPAPKPVARAIAKPRVDDDDEGGGSYGLALPGGGRAAVRAEENEEETGTYDLSKGGGGRGGEDDGPRDKPLPDFRLGSGQRGKKRKKK